jgi:hypothetical protein
MNGKVTRLHASLYIFGFLCVVLHYGKIKTIRLWWWAWCKVPISTLNTGDKELNLGRYGEPGSTTSTSGGAIYKTLCLWPPCSTDYNSNRARIYKVLLLLYCFRLSLFLKTRLLRRSISLLSVASSIRPCDNRSCLAYSLMRARVKGGGWKTRGI